MDGRSGIDDPFPAVAEIKGHVAFYTDRVSVTPPPANPPYDRSSCLKGGAAVSTAPVQTGIERRLEKLLAANELSTPRVSRRSGSIGS